MEKNNFKKNVSKSEKPKKKFKLKDLLQSKPNWVAILLMLVLLIGGMSHYSEDVFAYTGAMEARRELVKGVKQQILYGVTREDFSLSCVEPTLQSIDQAVQNLGDETDLGEYFAKNDLTEKGRKVNAVAVNSIILSWWVEMLYLAVQFVRVVGWLDKGNKKHKDAKPGQEGKVSDHDGSAV